MKGDFLCLIRPDGHIGLIQQPIDLPSLRSYLDMLGPKQEELEGDGQLSDVMSDEIDSSEFIEVEDGELSVVQ